MKNNPYSLEVFSQVFQLHLNKKGSGSLTPISHFHRFDLLEYLLGYLVTIHPELPNDKSRGFYLKIFIAENETALHLEFS